jgi:Carboxypeptidase regulatory-like domain
MSRPRVAALLAALLLCLSIVSLAAAGGPADLPAWGTEPTPNAGFPRNVLNGVDAASPSDVWAVGSYEAAGFIHPRPLIERWNGAAWSSIQPGWNDEGELFGVAAVASNDVWMVGGYQTGGQALIAHWNGSALTVVPHPNPGNFNRLYSITAISANDIWAVGEYTNPISRTFALHWNGTSWTQVTTPTGDGYSHLYGVAAVSSNDVWAVGDDGGNSISLHWNGSQWSSVATTGPSGTTLRSVSATPGGEVWAVGDSAADSVTLHWNGSAWENVSAPNPGPYFLDLNGVDVISATDAWAVGYCDVKNGNWRTLTMHWDGSSWAVVGSPSPDPNINRLFGVVGLSGGEAWAVGHARDGSLALHRTGGDWVQTMTVNEGTGDNFLTGISVRASNDIWAVGNAQRQSLTLHYDGASWAVVPSPNRQYGIRLEGVDAIAANDAWAVGWSGSGNFDDENAALHWDGTSWSIVPTPQPGVGIDKLYAVEAIASNNVWAVGFYEDANDQYRSLILHWNGSSWAIVEHDCDTYAGLTGLTFVSPTDGWAVGDATTCHYNGTTWSLVPSPQPRIEYNEIAYPLEDASGVAANDVWAVGARVIDMGEYLSWQSLAEHWDGTSWTLTTFIPGTLVLGVEAVAANDVWAVGTDSYGPLLVHYDGTSWSTVPTPEWGRGGQLAGIDRVRTPVLSNRAAAPRGGGALWAAGYLNPGGQGARTLVERAPSPTQGAVVGSTNVAYATVSWFGPENGSTETDPYGGYQVGGLQAGTYTFIATEPGCQPDSRSVTVVAGQTIVEDFQIGCNRSKRRPRHRALGPATAAATLFGARGYSSVGRAPGSHPGGRRFESG